jgi:hypothetical protein
MPIHQVSTAANETNDERCSKVQLKEDITSI